MDAPLSKKEQDKPVSDTEGEKPVREQLKKASIDTKAEAARAAAESEPTLAETGAVSESLENGTPTNVENTDRGRLHRKRSFEETGGDIDADNVKTSIVRHPRKRSRDNIIGEEDASNIARSSGEHSREEGTSNGKRLSGELKRPNETDAVENGAHESTIGGIGSPKTKRSRVGEKAAVKEGEDDDTDVPKSTLDGIEDAVSKVGDSHKQVDPISWSKKEVSC